MNIPQLLHKLRIIANIEIVVPLLPEVLPVAKQTPRHALLQRLQCIGQRIQFCLDGWPIQARFWLEWGSLGLAEHEMNMLRHNYIAVNVQFVTTPHPLQS